VLRVVLPGVTAHPPSNQGRINPNTDGGGPDRSEARAPVVLEAFCGVGPVGSYAAASVPGVHLHLGDSDVNAVKCAVGNAQVAGQTDGDSEPTPSPSEAAPATTVVRGHRLDCLLGLPEELRHGIDIIAAVPPYVPTTAADFLPHEAVDFEPSTALFGGTDGLDLVRRLIGEAGDWLSPVGVLLIELGREQADDARAYAATHGLEGQSHLGEGDLLEDEGEAEHDVDEHTVVLELKRRF
jgi:release factor glutamine methyltransferase